MRKFILATLSAASLTAAGALYAGQAQAAPLFDGLQGAAPVSNIVDAQFFFFNSHRYCWYWDGWRGPGWYWCGYEFRRGLGWGGGYGWHGRRVPGYREHFNGRPPHGRPGQGTGPNNHGPRGPMGNQHPSFNRGGNGQHPSFNRGGIGAHPSFSGGGSQHPSFSGAGGRGPMGGSGGRGAGGGGGGGGGKGGGGGGGNKH